MFLRWVCLFCCRKICGPILGIYKSLTYTWMWTLDWGRAIPFLGMQCAHCTGKTHWLTDTNKEPFHFENTSGSSLSSDKILYYLLRSILKGTRWSVYIVVQVRLETEYITYYRVPGFFAVVWFDSFPSHPPGQQVVSLSRSSCVSPVELILTRECGEGRGKEPNYTTVRKPGPI
jgi:hypothetical protein